MVDDLVEYPCSSSANRQLRGDYPHDGKHLSLVTVEKFMNGNGSLDTGTQKQCRGFTTAEYHRNFKRAYSLLPRVHRVLRHVKEVKMSNIASIAPKDRVLMVQDTYLVN